MRGARAGGQQVERSLARVQRAIDTLYTAAVGLGGAFLARELVRMADTMSLMSARLDVAARERTTREVRAALDRRAEVPSTAAEHLHTVLEQADLVKFADARPDPSRAAEALQAARTAIGTIEVAVSAETSPVAETAPRSDASSR